MVTVNMSGSMVIVMRVNLINVLSMGRVRSILQTVTTIRVPTNKVNHKVMESIIGLMVLYLKVLLLNNLRVFQPRTT